MSLLVPLALAYCLVGSIYDLRERRIPNAVNYAGIAAGAAVAFFDNTLGVGFAIAVVLSFAFAYVLYRMGAWAGGDAKFFTGLSSFAAATGTQSPILPLELFLLSALFLIPVIVVLYSGVVWRQRNEIRASATDALRSGAESALLAPICFASLSLASSPILAIGLIVLLALIRVPLIVGVVLFALSFLLVGPMTVVGVYAASLVAVLLIRILSSSFAVLRTHAFREAVAIGKLKPGDVPDSFLVRAGSGVSVVAAGSLKRALSVALSGGNAFSVLARPVNAIAGPDRAAGLSQDAVAELKRRGVKQVVLRKTLPFAPVLAAGFVALVSGVALWLVTGRLA